MGVLEGCCQTMLNFYHRLRSVIAVLGNFGTGRARHSVRAVVITRTPGLPMVAGRGLPADVPRLNLTAIVGARRD